MNETKANVGIQECAKCEYKLRCDECYFCIENKRLKEENERLKAKIEALNKTFSIIGNSLKRNGRI